jgi:hypothetical protein
MLAVAARAQSSLPGGVSTSLTPPTIDAKLTFGFNYDLLRAPTDVSFDYAQGYAAINFPFSQANFISKSVATDLWTQMSNQMGQQQQSGQQFQPQAGAAQFANTTIRVDVPMLGGVASFSDIQNVYLNYTTSLGNTDLLLSYDTTTNSNGSSTHTILFLRGAINVPIDATLGWETMTFGYAYKINKDLVVAANLHRHLFRLDMDAKTDVDMLGYFKLQQSGSAGISLPNEPIDYSSQKVYGEASGHYQAEAWSESFGIKYWRFTLTSRFGVDTKARGSMTAKYYLPFFIDPKTFKINLNLQDPTQLASGNMLNNFQQNAVDSVVYTSNEDATWKLPQGHTLTFDIIPNALSISYTKLFGDIEAYHAHNVGDSAHPGKQIVDLDAAITVDNVIMLSAQVYGAFINAGVFGLDMRVGDQDHILSNAVKANKQISWMRLGDAAMVPVLNLGAALGAKTQVAFELDVVPLPAFKVGLYYHF